MPEEEGIPYAITVEGLEETSRWDLEWRLELGESIEKEYGGSPWSCFRELEITRAVAVAVAVAFAFAVAVKTGGWHERGFFLA